MPYTIRKKDNEFCLLKVNPDDSVSQLGCHGTRGEAVDQQQAISASEGSEKCGDDCDCDECNRTYRSVAYAKYKNKSIKCGCGAGPGALITINDLARGKKKTKKGG